MSVIRITELEGETWRILSGKPVRPLTDGRHGNKILKKEQHLFTLEQKGKIAQKKLGKGSGMKMGLSVLLR